MSFHIPYFEKKHAKMLLLVILFSLIIIYTIPWIIQNAFEKEYSGIDFHGYWYAGHFVRQGVNSYAALMNNPNPIYWNPQVLGSGDPQLQTGSEYSLRLPIQYLDGSVVKEHPIAQTLIVVPAVTAPLNLLLGMFSWFSWPVARLAWVVLNLIFATVIPWLAIRLIPKHQYMEVADKLIFALIFYNFYGLRQSIVVGQQTLICLLLLILALLTRDNWMVSGLLLGFGISKYSVGLPIFTYLLLQKKYRTILVSIIIQVIAILFLIPFKWGSPIDTLIAYYKIVQVNYLQDGVHLLARFPEGQIKIVLFLVILFTAIFFLGRQYYYRRAFEIEENIVRLNDLNLITLAIFLITYHRIHDMPFMIFFLISVVIVLVEARNRKFNQFQRIVLSSIAVVIVLLILFPTLLNYATVNIEISENVSNLWSSVEGASSISLLLMFAISIWIQVSLLFDVKILETSN